MRPQYQVYIEDQLIDLDPKTVIATTIQASDFASGDIINRKASFTNQIRVPASQNNIKIFEYANNSKSGSEFPYNKKSVRLMSNGIQLFDGLVMIKSFDNFFNIQMYSQQKDLSFRITNKFLSDIDFGDSPITWSAAFIDSKRASTSGWCAPVVNYGQIDTTALLELSIGTYYLPSISYKDILTKIFTNAGYTLTGDFYSNDTTLSKMVMLYSKDSFPASATIKMNDVMPTDFLQSDFIKDFLIKFNAFLRFNNNSVEIVTLDSILKDTFKAIDWTNKRVKNHRDIVQYNWNRFAQRNNFNYSKPDNLLDGVAWDNPNGYLSMDNASADPSNDIYTSIFHSPNLVKTANPSFPALGVEQTAGTTAGVFYCSTSEIWKTFPTSYTFDSIPKPMVAILDDPDIPTNETSIKYNGTSRSDYKIARFNPNVVITNKPQALAWRQIITGARPTSKGLLDTYYDQIQLRLDNGLISSTHEYNLNDIDINGLDLLVPIYDDGEYFLINKVNNYVSERTTRVELLKI